MLLIPQDINKQSSGSSKIELPKAAENFARYADSCEDFMMEAMWTKDEADKVESTKKYPDKPYLRYMINKIVMERLIAIVKHRRMILTWTGCGVLTHDAMFLENRLNVIISKKEEDSDDLVKRCKFIYDNIPRSILPYKPDCRYKYCLLEFPEIGSAIRGIAQGPDQLRQYTCSRILADEIAFWPHAKSTFVSMKPTIQGGGQICLISTRFPGFFKQIIEDTIDE